MMIFGQVGSDQVGSGCVVSCRIVCMIIISPVTRWFGGLVQRVLDA